ncbi:MAG: ATPase, T2SS/T4P/T4SS family [Peptostreptococcaceae bacterium]|nr:ATPase, T2SS/T4P/T4SS family [Peptostreptococcaceae bacterium]
MRRHKLVYGVNAVLDEHTARELRAIPAYYEGDILQVFCEEGFGSEDRIRRLLGKNGSVEIAFHALHANEIERILNTYYSIELKELSIFEQIREFIREERFERSFLYIVEQARKLGASDIHLAKEQDLLIIRYRLKGILKTFCVLDGTLLSVLGRIIKVKGGVDISRSLRPIDTRLALNLEEVDLDIRVSIVNTMEGEKYSLRLLHNENVPHSLIELGLEEEDRHLIREGLMKEAGAILITGPTGSGKSTTVRCFLHELNHGTGHIISIEDPIEYRMEGVTQIQVDDREGRRFSDGVRAVLRQDPDVLFIGEIRDEISAEVAMKASITGHLVFTTLHTRSASLAMERLENLGIDRHLLMHSISMIINQRLVGESCEHCKQEEIYRGEDVEALGLKKGDRIFRSEGCARCDYSGIARRVPVMAILTMDDHNRRCYIEQGELREEKEIRSVIIKKFQEGKISLTEARKFL